MKGALKEDEGRLLLHAARGVALRTKAGAGFR